MRNCNCNDRAPFRVLIADAPPNARAEDQLLRSRWKVSVTTQARAALEALWTGAPDAFVCAAPEGMEPIDLCRAAAALVPRCARVLVISTWTRGIEAALVAGVVHSTVPASMDAEYMIAAVEAAIEKAVRPSKRPLRPPRRSLGALVTSIVHPDLAAAPDNYTRDDAGRRDR